MKRRIAAPTPSAKKPFKKPRTAGPTKQYLKESKRRLVYQETKSFDTALDFTFDLTGEIPATGQLSLILEGDGNANRDGQKVQVTSVQLKGTLRYVPAAAATAADSCSLYLIYDRQPNGQAATVFGGADPNSIFTSTNVVTALRAKFNSERFTILKHWTWDFNLCGGVTTAYNNYIQHLDFYTKCDLELNYRANAGAVTDLTTGNIFLVAGTAGFSDDLITFSGNARLNFFG